MRRNRNPAGGRRKIDAYLRQVMDGLGPHMFVGLMTVDGTLVEANGPALAAAGLTLDDVIGKPFDETYWWSYAEPVQQQLRAAIGRAADGIGSRYDVQVRAADGQMIDIDFSLQPLRDEAGAVALLVPSAVVITDRKRSERALRESEATLDRILETTPSGVVLVSPAGDITFANAAAERLAGVAPGSMAGRRFDDPVWQFFTVDGRPVPDDQQLFSRVLRTGRPVYGAEMAARRADGTTLILLINAAPMYDAEGTLAGVVGAFDDITDRKSAEEALRGSEERLRLALDAARIGSFDWDIPHDRVTWSRRIEEMWGFAPGEFGGTYESFASRVHPDDMPGIDAEVARCVATRTPFEREFRVVRPDGSVHWFIGRGEFTFDARGRPLRLLGIGVEVTAQKQSEDRLQESAAALRALSERLAMVREEEGARIARELHDELGQALTGLKMDLSWIDKRLAGLEDGGRVAPLRERSAAMLQLLDSTVQAVRRIAADLRPSLIDDLGLAAAIEWQAAEFERRSGIGCSASIPPDLPPLDPARAVALYRILQEALTNVVRHAGAGHVGVTLACDGTALRLDVQDNGCGIDPAIKPSSRALGLLGMHERARVFGGTVTVSPGAPRGTLVRVRIPL